MEDGIILKLYNSICDRSLSRDINSEPIQDFRRSIAKSDISSDVRMA